MLQVWRLHVLCLLVHSLEGGGGLNVAVWQSLSARSLCLYNQSARDYIHNPKCPTHARPGNMTLSRSCGKRRHLVRADRIMFSCRERYSATNTQGLAGRCLIPITEPAILTRWARSGPRSP